MARTALAVQTITRTGLTPVYTAANVDGVAIGNSTREVLHVKTGVTPTNVALVTPGTVDAQPIGDRVIVIGASSERMIGPFPADVYNQPGGSDVWVDFSAISGVTVAALRTG